MKKIQKNSTVRYIGGNDNYDKYLKKDDIYTVEIYKEEKDPETGENLSPIIGLYELPIIKRDEEFIWKQGFDISFFELIFEDNESVWDRLSDFE